MPQVRTELAPTVALLLQDRNTLYEMVDPYKPNEFHGQQEMILEFIAGIDLLHIVVQLIEVSKEDADKIFEECEAFKPQFYRMTFVSFTFSHHLHVG